MEYWQYLSGFAAVILAALAIRSAVVKKRKRKERDFTRKLETVLQPRENVKVICPNHGSRWILTSRRLLLDTKDGFLAIPFGKIKKLVDAFHAGTGCSHRGRLRDGIHTHMMFAPVNISEAAGNGFQ